MAIRAKNPRLRAGAWALLLLMPAVARATCEEDVARLFQPGPEGASKELALSSQPFREIQQVNFPPEVYRDITERMRKQVAAWVEAAAEDPVRYQTLKSHLTHLQGLEDDLLRFRKELEAAGVSVERLQAQIWTHDIGKFVPADKLVAARHANNANPYFAQFLDHSKTSQQYLRNHPFYGSEGGLDNVTRQLYYDIAGHDGPAVPGSWWGENYGKNTVRAHPAKPGVQVGGRYPQAESPYLVVLDRLDQSAMIASGGELAGGPRKISLQVRGQFAREMAGASKQAVEQRSIWHGLYSVPEGTNAQYLALKQKYAAQLDTPLGDMLELMRVRVERVRKLRAQVHLYGNPADAGTLHVPADRLIPRPAGMPADAIGQIEIQGKLRSFRSLEEFYGNGDLVGVATEWERRTPK